MEPNIFLALSFLSTVLHVCRSALLRRKETKWANEKCSFIHKMKALNLINSLCLPLSFCPPSLLPFPVQHANVCVCIYVCVSVSVFLYHSVKIIIDKEELDNVLGMKIDKILLLTFEQRSKYLMS